jgi:hypothetical protein
MLGDLLDFAMECKREGFPIDTPVHALIGFSAPELKITGLVARQVVNVSPEPRKATDLP